MELAPLPTMTKPRLRGVFHQLALVLFFTLTMPLLFRSAATPDFWPVFFYSLSVCWMFAISTLYHRPHWTPGRRALFKRLDHSAIYLFMLGTAAPICLIGMRYHDGQKLLQVMVIACLIGMVKALFFPKTKKWISSLIPTCVTFFILPFVPQMLLALGSVSLFLLILGGLLNGLGGLAYAIKKPNPWPKVFGYHEVFHILSVVGAFCNYLVIVRILH